MKKRICRYCHQPSTGTLKVCRTCQVTKQKHAEIEERNNRVFGGDAIDLDNFAALDAIRGGFRRTPNDDFTGGRLEPVVVRHAGTATYHATDRDATGK